MGQSYFERNFGLSAWASARSISLIGRAPKLLQELEGGNVGEVLGARGGALVSQQMLHPDHAAANPIAELGLDTVGPRLAEGDPAYGREHVDSSGLDSDLEADARGPNIFFREPHERCAKQAQSPYDARGILHAGLDPDVKVLGGPRPAVNAEGIGPHHHEAGVSGL
jgi:hypothetical protein